MMGFTESVAADMADRLVGSGAVRFGKFTLASGGQSDYYIDCKRLLLDGEHLHVVASLLAGLFTQHLPHLRYVGGPEVGVVPLVGAVVAAMGRPVYRTTLHPPVRGFWVRREPKKHGTGSLVEGGLADADPGQPVVVLEDVVTTGGSVLRTIDAVEALGHTVEAVLAVVDRNEGGTEAIQARVPRYHALVDAPAILARAPKP